MEWHNKSSEYCNNIGINYNETYPVSNEHWTDIFTPGSLSEKWIEKDSEKLFFKIRCSFYFNVGAMKVILALKKYEMENKSFPETIQDLVPGYLASIPLDYYSGRPLLYSKENQWVYALGANGEDDGGEKAGITKGYCQMEPACHNNPTFPLSAH